MTCHLIINLYAGRIIVLEKILATVKLQGEVGAEVSFYFNISRLIDKNDFQILLEQSV